jgi:hypothetical protein
MDEKLPVRIDCGLMSPPFKADHKWYVRVCAGGSVQAIRDSYLSNSLLIFALTSLTVVFIPHFLRLLHFMKSL